MGARRAVGAAAVTLVVVGGAVVVTRLAAGDPTGRGPAGAPSYPVRASADGASLVDADGDPYLYLADTVWLAPSRLDRAGMVDLLDTRAAQGFTTLQVSALPFLHLPGDEANAYGDVPVEDLDLARPVEVGGRTDDPSDPGHDYWDHLDTLLTLAAERGMQVTVVPSWYGYQGEDWRGHVDTGAARAYGRFLGARLGHHPNLVWLLGGDNAPRGDTGKVPEGARRGDVLEATDAMARAIRAAEAVPHLMSYHATRGTSSTEHVGGAQWHTFVSAYSDALTWRAVAGSRGTGLPVVLTEAFYDGREQFTLLDRRALRAQAWWAVLAGAGFAYGHEDVWDLDPGHGPDSSGGADSWRDALRAPSAGDVTVLADTVRELLPLRPAGDDVVVSGRGDGADRVVAARSADGRTALVYVPGPRSVEVRLDALSGGDVRASWLDPRDGTRTDADVPDGADVVEVRPPRGLDDAVLVLQGR